MANIIQKRELVDTGTFFLIFGEKPYPTFFIDDEEEYVYEKMDDDDSIMNLELSIDDGDFYPFNRVYARLTFEEFMQREKKKLRRIIKND